MACENFKADILLFRDGTLSEERRELLEEHLAACERCRCAYEAIVSFEEALSGPPENGGASEEMVKSFRLKFQEVAAAQGRRTGIRHWLYAVAAMFIAALGVLAFWPTREKVLYIEIRDLPAVRGGLEPGERSFELRIRAPESMWLYILDLDTECLLNLVYPLGAQASQGGRPVSEKGSPSDIKGKNVSAGELVSLKMTLSGPPGKGTLIAFGTKQCLSESDLSGVIASLRQIVKAARIRGIQRDSVVKQLREYLAGKYEAVTRIYYEIPAGAPQAGQGENR